MSAASPSATLPPVLQSGRVAGVDFTVLGDGDGPVTVFAHGLGGTSGETRPLALKAPGTRVLLTFRGHGASDALVDGWDYDVLAEDLLAVADHVGAEACVGLSLGCGALLRVLRDQPDRFARLAMIMPAALDSARTDGATVRLEQLGAAIDRGDVEAVTALLMTEVPAALRERKAVPLLLARRAAELVQRPAPVPRTADRPLADRSVLSAVTAPTLVVGQSDDRLHPLELAREVAAALPNAELLALPEGGVFWTCAAQAQAALAAHLEDS
ncbi:MAG: putative hydrolase or acyltransferase of alpha/beta superfamily [Frankiales bacterium]|nr:putative hydrolase or acyltransferase of alpha/beta superfamily [Frankiales bacterium]